MGTLKQEGEQIFGTFKNGFLEGKGMIITENHCKVAEFKKGVRDGSCTTYNHGEITFEGMCKIEPEGFGKFYLKDGRIFEGEISKSLMKEGIMLYPDGSINYEIFDNVKDAK
jgi:antitoxin component YwqK of YwqJK toxin-antitoxin module